MGVLWPKLTPCIVHTSLHTTTSCLGNVTDEDHVHVEATMTGRTNKVHCIKALKYAVHTTRDE